MERTFSLEARAVVPTTQGFTMEMPRAGRIKMNPTKSTGGTKALTGASDCAAEDRHEPDHAAKDASQRACLFGGEIQLFVEIVGEGGESAVVGEALEDFGDVGDPEGALETGADFLEPLAKAHIASEDARRDDSMRQLGAEPLATRFYEFLIEGRESEISSPLQAGTQERAQQCRAPARGRKGARFADSILN